jgi:hypothetical protein
MELRKYQNNISDQAEKICKNKLSKQFRTFKLKIQIKIVP